MKRNKLFTGLVLAGLTLGAGACGQKSSQSQPKTAAVNQTPAAVESPSVHDGHGSQTKPKLPMPAYQSAESAKNLKPILSPEMFQGAVRASYAAVREIPETIAQLPCFCRCDRSAGHKSLHSCFEDDHAAHCGICMNSALKAYKLQKEQKLNPQQIRDQLAAEYANL